MIFKKYYLIFIIVLFCYSCSEIQIFSGKIKTDKTSYKRNEIIRVEFNITGAARGDCVILVNKNDPDTTMYDGWIKITLGESSNRISFPSISSALEKATVARYLRGCEATKENKIAESPPFTYGLQ